MSDISNGSCYSLAFLPEYFGLIPTTNSVTAGGRGAPERPDDER